MHQFLKILNQIGWLKSECQKSFEICSSFVYECFRFKFLAYFQHYPTDWIDSRNYMCSWRTTISVRNVPIHIFRSIRTGKSLVLYFKEKTLFLLCGSSEKMSEKMCNYIRYLLLLSAEKFINIRLLRLCWCCSGSNAGYQLMRFSCADVLLEETVGKHSSV